MSKALKYTVLTYGCQMNHSDSQRLSKALEDYGYSMCEDMQEADLVLFNTCSIKQRAEDKVLGQMNKISKLKKTRPNLLMGITGCMTRITSTKNSEKKDKLFKTVKSLDLCFQIQDMTKLGGMLSELTPDLKDLDMQQADLKNYFQIQPKYQSDFQAYVPIMTGCDKFCTYCIVPYSRGREISRPIDEVYQEVLQLVQNGCLEITLLGQNVNSYGLSWADKKQEGKFSYETAPFVQLLRKLDKIEGLERLRFTSPHPQDMTNDVVDAVCELRTLMPYIHLPLQSGNDYILRKMNRNYDKKKFKQIVDYIREKMPDASISTDMIVGFCGETEEIHNESRDFFEDMGFDLAFISQYSSRSGTTAGMLKKDDVSAEEKKRRFHELNEALKRTSFARNEYFRDKTVQVLVEKQYDEGQVSGRSEHFKEVIFEGSKELIGKIVPVKILSAQEWRLMGELVS
ncbi:tRNA (N6-isopentenyl adenosine(37)-C2)-methylthiotransferase MiaB [bacterium]|nr:tRNA (N6-isopentenyl adenosine(37)-C2)-methylthiotransferase MiaB [bacterium]